MPNLVSALKAEITRLARKELRSQTEGLKKSLASQRQEISALRKRVLALEHALRQVEKRRGRAAPIKAQARAGSDESGTASSRFRFTAQGLATNRKRLGLSAADFGLLVGTTGQSVYAWEQGKAKPRAGALRAIAELRAVGKREVTKRLSELKQRQ